MNLTARHCTVCFQKSRSSLLKSSGVLRERRFLRFKFHPTLGSRNRLAQPVRPLHIEVDIIGSPDDQSGCL